MKFAPLQNWVVYKYRLIEILLVLWYETKYFLGYWLAQWYIHTNIHPLHKGWIRVKWYNSQSVLIINSNLQKIPIYNINWNTRFTAKRLLMVSDTSVIKRWGQAAIVLERKFRLGCRKLKLIIHATVWILKVSNHELVKHTFISVHP